MEFISRNNVITILMVGALILIFGLSLYLPIREFQM